MNIITHVDRNYSEDELKTAFQLQVDKNLAVERATSALRDNQAAKEAKGNVGKTHPVLGRCVANIPAREYFRLIKKYGHDEVHSKGFIQFLQKKHPELCANKM